MTEPTLMNAYRAAKVPASPAKVRFASSGSTTWKLNARVPITAVISNVIRNAGVDHA